ncbi:hypothetical protein K9T45_001716, partial [Campylobacter jejuni]|nr:hypothetical protein [Campylobacter jejuni]
MYFSNANVATFNNSGTVKSNSHQGVSIISGSTIQNLTNIGTIISNTDKEAINIRNTKINTFTNEGLIYSNGSYEALYLNRGTIDTITNSGTIKSNSSNNGALYLNRATIKTLTNNGIIKSTGTKEPSTIISISSGVMLARSTIENFTNTGSISGIVGVNLAQVTIDNFTNKGTIESTSSNTLAAGVNLMTIREQSSTIGNFINEGTIKSQAQGILIEAGNTINTITNKGAIDASLNGIDFFDNGDVSGETVKLSKIILENGSTIKARRNGINLAGSSKPIQADNIEVKSGASVSGDNAGIAIGADKKVNGQIKIEGSVTGGQAGIVNEGIIGNALDSSSDANTGIVITKSGSINSSRGRSGIVNQGNG